jgi:hypothetical protein
MFKRADDKKSDLILTVLSWVDHIKPKYCLFENVPGFLGYKLNAQQNGKHALRGGIENGGIKFLVRSLTALGCVQPTNAYTRNSHAHHCVVTRFVLRSYKPVITVSPKAVNDSSCGQRYLDILSQNFLVQRMTSHAGLQCQSNFPLESPLLRSTAGREYTHCHS